MSGQQFSDDERRVLLRLARRGLRSAAQGQPLPTVDMNTLPEILHQPGACFVTLHTANGQLRGCTGTLLARTSIAREVLQTAAQTATHDPRFNPVTADEASTIDIEISVLTPPHKLTVSDPRQLPDLLRPGIDGVTLRKGYHRATFLPQVWEKIPDPTAFLDRLCLKMGLSHREWLLPGMEAEVYQVEEFSEKEMSES